MTVTIINGGTQGLGEAIARKLVATGSTGLALIGRSTDRGEALAGEFTAAGTPTRYLHADVTEDGAPQRLVDAAVAHFGTIHGLVNVAAATTRATLFDDTPEHFRRMMKLNSEVPYFFIQAVARHMVATGTPGSIVNIGSTTGHGGQTKLTAYAMSKGAMSIMTKNLAFGLMHHRIRVNQVNPGWMDTISEHLTQVNLDGSPENWLEAAEASRPMGRLVKPWEVANVVALCLSDDSGLMTGNCIDIDQSVQGAGNPPIPTWADTPMP